VNVLGYKKIRAKKARLFIKFLGAKN